MTVAALPAIVEYLEDGVSTSFPVPFRFKAATDLIVERIAAGQVGVLTIGVDYSVVGGVNDAGGTLTRTAATAGATLRIRRRTARAQPMPYPIGGRFPAKSHEEALDRQMLVAQEQDATSADLNARSIMVPPGERAPVLAPAASRTGGRKVLAPNPVTGAIEVRDAGADFKGDPGGSPLAIGLFTAANGMDIPPGIDMVQTTGQSKLGIDPALYSYRADLPPSAVAQNPHTAFAAKDNRVFMLCTGDRASLGMYGDLTVGSALPQLQAAYRDLSDRPASPPIPGANGFGRGLITVPKVNAFVGDTWAPSGAFGLVVQGTSRYSSSLVWALDNGVAIDLTNYYGVTFENVALINDFKDPENSIGIQLTTEGGGAYLCLKAVELFGFNVAIDNSVSLVNGDKALFERTQIIAGTGYKNTGNNQAFGNTWLNCSGGCGIAQFELGGCGTETIINFTGDLYGTFIKYPEGSGNPGSDHEPSHTLLLNTRLEQHATEGAGAFANTLVDARESKMVSDLGGSNTDLLAINGWVRGQRENVQDPETSFLAVFGDLDTDGKYRGSERQRLKLFGGWFTSQVIRHCSQFFGRIFARSFVHYAIRAPRPERMQLLGEGFHPLYEWRHNENVPVDQYRGGQSFVGAIDAEKAFLWHPVSNVLMSSAGGDAFASPAAGALNGAIPAGETRYGRLYTISGFPAKCSFAGLGVYIDANPGGSDILVEWFADAGATVLIGSTMVAGNRVGLQRLGGIDPAKLPTGTTVYVRMTKSAPGQIAYGPVVLFYFPLMGDL